MSESQKILDEHFPLLNEIDLAVALNACKDAGAVNAAKALSKHIIRLEITISRLKGTLTNDTLHSRPDQKN